MNAENVVQAYVNPGEGFLPLVISRGWQVSQLNDRLDLHADTLSQIERHDATDEVFILVHGAATLVAVSESAHRFEFEVVSMKPGITYNIPRGVWHAIMTSPGMQVMIVEKDNTHVDGVVRRTLTDEERAVLRSQLISKEGLS